jgi:tripartite-type tricarboxylate transporter receptor subunit TctC
MEIAYMAKFSRLLFTTSVVAAVMTAAPARAESVAEFYKDKTLRIVIGTSMGGSYGVYGQLVARHLGKFLPGSPTVIVQSMPGAGGLVALNYLAQKAPRDGTTLSVIHVTLVQEGMFNPRAQYDAAEFQWIGRLASITFLGVASKKSGIKTLEDARKREVIVGAPGANNVPAQSPVVVNKIAGTKFKVITGYKGMGEVFIALERGEVEFAVPTEATLAAFHQDLLKKGELVPIFAQAGQRLKNHPNVPILLEFGKTEVEKAFLGIFTLTAEIGRSLATTPGVPKDRLEALRAGFEKMIVDPEFKADLAKTRVALDPKSGAEMQKLVLDAMTMSKETKEQAREFYNELFKK